MAGIFLSAQDSTWYPAFLAPVVEAVGTHGAGSVLDIGTGPGTLAAMLLKALPGLHFLGLDTSPAMIRQAQARVHHPLARFAVIDGQLKAAVTAGSFDVVTVCSVLYLLPEDLARRLVVDALTALRPGGVLLLYHPSGNSSLCAALTEVWGFPFSWRNWTYCFWRLATASRARNWHRQSWLSALATAKGTRLDHHSVFDGRAILTILQP